MLLALLCEGQCPSRFPPLFPATKKRRPRKQPLGARHAPSATSLPLEHLQKKFTSYSI